MFKIGKRRVQVLGGSKFLNLPKNWIENFGIDKGDNLELCLDEKNNLVVKTPCVSKEGGADEE